MSDLWKEDAQTPELQAPDVDRRDVMLAEIEQYMRREERPPNSMTVKEIFDQMGSKFRQAQSIDLEKIRKQMFKLVKAGQYKGRKMNADGREQWYFWKVEDE